MWHVGPWAGVLFLSKNTCASHPKRTEATWSEKKIESGRGFLLGDRLSGSKLIHSFPTPRAGALVSVLGAVGLEMFYVCVKCRSKRVPGLF